MQSTSKKATAPKQALDKARARQSSTDQPGKLAGESAANGEFEGKVCRCSKLGRGKLHVRLPGAATNGICTHNEQQAHKAKEKASIKS